MKKILRYAIVILFVFSLVGLAMAKGGGFYADRQTGIYDA